MDEQEKPKAIIKRPVKVSASYVKPNFKIVDGKMVYDRSFKSFKQEENDKILGAYQKRHSKVHKEDVAKIREENEKRREEARRKNDFTISFASYLEKVSLNILEDVINYALVEDEKEFIYTLFNGDYGKSVVTKLKNKVKRFNKINIKINSFINYIVEFIEEYEEFLNRLKDFPKDEDYNLYQIKDLKTFLDIPYDANLKFILKMA